MGTRPFITWTASPELIDLGAISIRWYGLLFALAFLSGYYLFVWFFRRENKPEEDLSSLLVYLLLGTLIGARLGHCLFYEPGYYLSRPFQMLMIWKGGLASHGGAVGILAALYFYSRRHRDQPYLWLLDRLVIATALGGAFIRLGNLFNSEIVGIPTDVPWAFVFTRIDTVPRHPAQLYESISYLLIFLLLLVIYRERGAKTPRGLLTGLFLILVFGARFLIEFVKMPQAAFSVPGPFSMGQLLSVPAVIAGIVLLLRVGKTNLKIE